MLSTISLKNYANEKKIISKSYAIRLSQAALLTPES